MLVPAVLNNCRYIQEDGVSAFRGLAVDEYLTETFSEPDEEKAALRLYTYKTNCALVGRFQNIYAELDLDTCKKEGVDFSRRLTGGGAIIMGESQLGICFCTSSDVFPWQNLKELYVLFSSPVINTLGKLGIKAEFRSKNDLEVNGKKIAGLGIYVTPKGAIQFHTSLLVDLDILEMLKVLQIPIQKYSDKRKITSVEQRITTINREINTKISIDEVREMLKEEFEAFFDFKMANRPLTKNEDDSVGKLIEERYQNEDWIYQHSPQTDMTGMSVVKTPAGLLRTYIGLKGETIKSVLITGDFLEEPETFRLIEGRLKWSPLDREKIEKVVRTAFSETKTIENLPQEKVVDAIYLAARRARSENRFTYDGSCYYPEKAEG
ncbi:MAG: lipoate--protein ligase family protein [Bacteroidetes bacterium]|nr:MAG: lipoate--protein ligase family protein [Bacteroidota bacterium]